MDSKKIFFVVFKIKKFNKLNIFSLKTIVSFYLFFGSLTEIGVLHIDGVHVFFFFITVY